MAKSKYELSTLSKANKDLALLIDEDLKKESELLQRLIKEVYEANQQVKESHMKRVQETQDKLKILNAEIDHLKQDIDQKDHETTIEQFNYLLKSKDEIFDALNTMRLFSTHYYLDHPLKNHLDHLKKHILDEFSNHYTQSDSLNKTIYQPLNELIILLIDRLFYSTNNMLDDHFLDSDNLHSKKVDPFSHQDAMIKTLFKELKTLYTTLKDSHTHFYYQSAEDDFLSEKIDELYEKAVSKINQKKDKIKSNYLEKVTSIDKELKDLETETLSQLKEKYKKRLEDEQKLRETIQDDLKQIRFDIMVAERKQDVKELENLMKRFDNLEKQNLNLYEEKVKQLADNKIKKQRAILIKQRKKLEIKREEELLKARIALETEKVKFNESTALFKLREDQKALEHDITLNNQLLVDFKTFYGNLNTYKKHLFDFYDTIMRLSHALLLSLVKIEQDTISLVAPVKKEVKKLELKLVESLKKKSFTQAHLRVELDYSFKEARLNLLVEQAIKERLHDETKTTLSGKITSIRAQESAKNELIYQHALLEIAEKEKELQLIKIESLYDSEVDLTKSQAERLNIGIGVNESMLKTTVESQIHFAKQQIRFAETEYDARIENIDRTKAQEIEYALGKLNQAKQIYLYDKNELIKERDQKLETLSYRMALFTETKDRKKLKDQEEAIKSSYQEKIDAIDEALSNDQAITRYQKQIDAAEKRAEKAKDDALNIKARSIETFKDLLTQSEEKLEIFTKKREEALIPYIESVAGDKAKLRLDEALEEVNEQYLEKISAPKARIEILENELKNMAHSNDEASTYISEIEEKKVKHREALSALAQEKEHAHQVINEEATIFLNSIHDALEKVSLNDDALLQTKTLEKIKQQVEHFEKDQVQALNRMNQELSHSLSAHMQSLSKKIDVINKKLDSAIRVYKRYLKSTSQSQTSKQKTIIKTLEEKHKNTLEEIERRY